MSKVCLIVIFNHRFDKNIEKLRSLYKDKFEDIKFIVPFYTGDASDVIPVYESSRQFQGYIAQAYKDFVGDYDHYMFVADDMLINPKINSENYKDWFGLEEGISYITDLYPLSEWDLSFERIEDGLRGFENLGVNYAGEIPSAEEAFRVAEEKGFTNFSMSSKVFGNNKMSYWLAEKRLLKRWLRGKIKGKRDLPYPLMQAYSDFFVISKEAIKEFSRMCGVFAAMNIFVETALPTALMLAERKITKASDFSYNNKIMWTEKEVSDLGEANSWSARKVLEKMDANCICVHPIKLSKWTVE